LHSSLSMNFSDIVAFLLVWDDDAEFCHMMHVNCGFNRGSEANYLEFSINLPV
jgi:hypothetical protein